MVTIWPTPRHSHPARTVVDVVRRDRDPPPALALFPGSDNPRQMHYIVSSRGYDYSGSCSPKASSRRKVALSGRAESDMTSKSWRRTGRGGRPNKGAPAPVEAFKRRALIHRARGGTLADSSGAMNALRWRTTPEARANSEGPDECARPRNRNPYGTDYAGRNNPQGAPLYRRPADRTAKTAPDLIRPRPSLACEHSNIVTRKTRGGIETDLDAPCSAASQISRGFTPRGEAAGFGGGGMLATFDGRPSFLRRLRFPAPPRKCRPPRG